MPSNKSVKPFVFLSEQSFTKKEEKPLPPKDEQIKLVFDVPNIKKVIPFSPSSFKAAKDIAQELLTGATIILSLDSMSKVEAVRLLDFLSGIVYVFNGIMIEKSETEFEVSIINPIKRVLVWHWLNLTIIINDVYQIDDKDTKLNTTV